jgi:hypothetical protein
MESVGIAPLIKKHNNSVLELLSSTYPEYDWLPWKFEKCPYNYFDDVKNQAKFIEWAAQQLNIKDMSDWYQVKLEVTNPAVTMVTIRISIKLAAYLL